MSSIIKWFKVTIELSGVENSYEEEYCIPVAHNEDRDKTIKQTLIDVLGGEDKTFKILKIEEASSCFGCRNRSPGQRDHMDYGGCLYEEN